MSHRMSFSISLDNQSINQSIHGWLSPVVEVIVISNAVQQACMMCKFREILIIISISLVLSLLLSLVPSISPTNSFLVVLTMFISSSVGFQFSYFIFSASSVLKSSSTHSFCGLHFFNCCCLDSLHVSLLYLVIAM